MEATILADDEEPKNQSGETEKPRRSEVATYIAPTRTRHDRRGTALLLELNRYEEQERQKSEKQQFFH